MRDSAIFYRSFYEAIKQLPSDIQLDVYNAVFEFMFNFKEVELNGLGATIFTLIKPQLEANKRKFDNGKKAKQKQKISKTEAKDKQNTSKHEANVNVNVNDNKNDIISPSLRQLCLDYHKQNPDKYPNDFYKDFIEYWTTPIQEKGKNFGKELWRAEKTFNIGMRLKTSYAMVWEKKNKVVNKVVTKMANQ